MNINNDYIINKRGNFDSFVQVAKENGIERINSIEHKKWKSKH